MAYPTGNFYRDLEEIDRAFIKIKVMSTRVRDESLAATLKAGDVLDLFSNLVQARARLQSAPNSAEFIAFARAQKNLPGLDVLAEYQAAVTALTNCITWVQDNFPKSTPAGFLFERTLGATGPVMRIFTASETAGLRTQLNALIATIE